LVLAVGIPLGIISATHKDEPIDHASRLFALSGVSIPGFWLGLLMLLVFYYRFQLLGLPFAPSGERMSAFLDPPLEPITGFLLLDSLLRGRVDAFLDALSHMILSTMTLGYHSLTVVVRMTRSSMLEVLRQDYITLARSIGLPERVVIYRHALKNAMIPTVTIVGVAFGGLLTGATITETVFSWPGLGRWAAGATLNSDVSAISGFSILAAFIYVMVNLLVDVLYAWFDPRVRYG
jgi:peptide/nickel transport system permease protein